jgi:hypothetical protein
MDRAVDAVAGDPSADISDLLAALQLAGRDLECLRDRRHDVLRFITDLTIPPTSNQAERDARPAIPEGAGRVKRVVRMGL